MNAWKIGDRVVWSHREGPTGGYRDVESVGTVTAVDLADTFRGVQVTFDEPLRPGSDLNVCYATHDEIRPLA